MTGSQTPKTPVQAQYAQFFAFFCVLFFFLSFFKQEEQLCSDDSSAKWRRIFKKKGCLP